MRKVMQGRHRRKRIMTRAPFTRPSNSLSLWERRAAKRRVRVGTTAYVRNSRIHRNTRRR